MNTKDDAPVSTGVLIVGTGFAGIGMAAGLVRAGRRDFMLVDKADGLGGTWRANTYPGCACDVPSHLYSFSFFPKADWSRAFAPQAEILAYLEACADHFELRRHMHFRAEVVEARYDDLRAFWRVTLADGRIIEAAHLVLGLGGLSRPAWPTIDGRADFAGPAFHTAEWRHDVPLAGRRVAIIGTGASAIQVVPRIVSEVAHLDLYQRTPPWILPKPDRAIPSWQQQLFSRVPLTRELVRAAIYLSLEARVLGFAIDPRIMAIARRQGLAHLERQVSDPALRAKLTPDYVPGCKRILMADDYYPAVSRPNVSVHVEGISRIVPEGVVTADGVLHPADVLIFATGFRVTDMLTPLRILGRDGVDLNARWAERTEAHLGTVIAGFPNLWVMTGPNTGLGHNSMVYMIESQMNLVLDALRQLDMRRAAAIEVRADVQAASNAALQERLAHSVWASGCASWYLDSRGHNSTLWPGFTFDFRRRTRRIQPTDYIWISAHQAARNLVAHTTTPTRGVA